MFTPVARPEIFHSSVFADNLVAIFQESYASGIDPSVRSEAAMLKKYYDHLKPFRQIDPPIDGHCVLAYDAGSKDDYIATFPLVMQKFLNTLNIRKLYLLNFNKTNLYSFPFENFRKLNQFKLLGGSKKENLGYRFKVSELHRGFPLFFFSGVYDVPVVFLITATGEVPLSLRLCDDGNLHLNFQEIYRHRIEEAAAHAGFLMGDLEICSRYGVNHYHQTR
ncbi:hypothetical protein GZH53_04720 [Flavihumibacter sp. R14]|nr:hypothetical protein [Flavihumibacter soli]